ncbi:mechanosensitive ion channel family protein [Mesorhizobium sp. BAC0120]|uniref:mechanosensitive ion channel family protein n=1 Tax=Mesorhizobium sp. BAC0120 TaxID=3090670 RepID=UPI00298C0F19|nr:mechanosensitive ion channel family protein [Mesorhizobium sp. BAC0120]MDW6026292.1 mechanosensitive ion channel family protein [Mesorhizobium sp. BAC0120]
MRAAVFATLMLLGGALPCQAEPAPVSEQLPPHVDQFLSLLANPDVQKWLETHRAPAGSVPVQPAQSEPFSHPLADRVSAVRSHIYGLAKALPTLPNQFRAAGSILAADIESVGFAGLFGLFVVLGVAAFGALWLYDRGTKQFVSLAAQLPITTRREYLIALLVRFGHELGRIAILAAASIAVFLALEYWPPLVEKIVLAYLLALILVFFAQAVLRVLLSPPDTVSADRADALRVVPLDGSTSAFWTRRLTAVVIIVALGHATALSLYLMSFSVEAHEIVSYLFGLALLAVGINTVRRALRPTAANEQQRNEAWISGKTYSGFLSAYFVALWFLWAVGATNLFWLAAIVGGLLWSISITERSVLNVLSKPSGSAGALDASIPGAALLTRGIRFILIISALLLIAWAWGIDLVALSAADTPATRAAHGIITALMILLVADFIWMLARSLIDRQIAKAASLTGDPSAAAQHEERLSTLLPVLRNVLFATLAAVAILMALSELGINIGPLIAGAGVAGVAIGFGAQTLVKDIISGMFYLLDDAFRVGEYIESGSYKGTVESFSLRSVRLRHSRGPIFTVPFGVLGAVQNLSRDYSIDKFNLTITYDSDLEKARKLIKAIGLELADDPELQPITMEPLKMQGVENFGDYGVELQLSLKTKPGQQSVVRRRALVMIKKAFDENGIKFGSPMMQSAGFTGIQPETAASATPVEPAASTVAVKPAAA